MALLSVFEEEQDVAALQSLHRPRGVPSEFLLGTVEKPSRITRPSERQNLFAAEIAVFAGAPLHEAPVKCVLGKLRHRPTEKEGREGSPFGIRGIGPKWPACAPRAIAMAPPAFLVERDRSAVDLKDSLRTARLIKSGDVLHRFTAAFAEIVFLLVRIHRGGPFEIEPQAGRIVSQTHAQAPQAFDHFDRERSDLHLVDAGTELA